MLHPSSPGSGRAAHGEEQSSYRSGPRRAGDIARQGSGGVSRRHGRCDL